MQTEYVIGKPKLYDQAKFLQRTEEIVRSGLWSNNGKYVKAVEDFYSEVHSTVTSNATTALEIALSVIVGRSKNRKIACPTFTFAATVSSIIRMGFEPVFIDCSVDYCMSTEDLSKVLRKEDVCLILPAHLFGNLCDIQTIDYLSYCYGMPALYDAAHCNGMTYRGENLGSFGAGAVFSHHPTKLAGGMELGIYSTSSEYYAKQAKLERNFGLSPDVLYDSEVVREGTNAKANEISAAAALTQLENIQGIIAHYKKIHFLYKELLPNNFFLMEPGEGSNYSYLVVETLEDTYDLIEYLKKYGIFARKYFRPLHTMNYFSKWLPRRRMLAESLYTRTLVLPTGLNLEEDDVKYICSKLSKY